MRSYFLGKNICNVGLRNYFLKIILTKKSKQIGLFYKRIWF